MVAIVEDENGLNCEPGKRHFIIQAETVLLLVLAMRCPPLFSIHLIYSVNCILLTELYFFKREGLVTEKD